ncbi:MAG: triose-phosphate isomerase [Hyphomicrobiales bacterium]|nr:triose-phosphate isomerase [Hyphomicrobiales bacterium]
MPRRRPLLAGNWKMHGLKSALGEAEAIAAWAEANAARVGVEIALCPPATLLPLLRERLVGGSLRLGAQDCSAEAAFGAFTGELSAGMLADAGADYIIVGHSERRARHGERDADVLAKAENALAAGASPIVCVGETAGERRLGLTLDVVRRQVRGSTPADAPPEALVIAYEPVWAIGAARTPEAADISRIHGVIRAELAGWLKAGRADAVRILYGGSLNPANAALILKAPDVDGGLVGGASLSAASFTAIAAVYGL